MTKFVKEQFESFGGYVHYRTVAGEQKFVARFKHQPGAKGSFITFLIKNFEVEEYFARLEAGESPLPIVETKGYLLPHIKRWLKDGGYPVNQIGFKQYIHDRIAKRQTGNAVVMQEVA